VTCSRRKWNDWQYHHLRNRPAEATLQGLRQQLGVPERVGDPASHEGILVVAGIACKRPARSIACLMKLGSGSIPSS
jgi:hypothetical protein